MLKKLFTATLLILALPAASAFAQTGTVAGTVTDSTSGDPVPGVNILIAGTQLGTATNTQGEFEIGGVPTGQQTVVASFVGYQTARVPVQVEANTTNQVDVELASASVQLQDVVVTALGIEREERSLGYAVEEVEGADLSEVPETNFVSSLQGRVAGANFNNSNSLGGSTRIVLRGPNSVTGNNQPLFVIDGVPINNENRTTTAGQDEGGGGYDYGNAAQFVNPENIASVSVLKGPSAAALYGSRGANGVIQITTKSGAGTEGIGVTVNTSVTARDVFGLPDYQNEFGGGANNPFYTTDGDFIREEGEQNFVDYGTDQSWGPRLDDGRQARQWYSWDNVNGLMDQETPWVSHSDNVENYFSTGLNYNTTVSFSHGGDDFDYRLSLSNVTETGVYPNSNLGRSQISFNGSADLTDRLTANANVSYVSTNAEGRPGTGYAGQNVFLQFNHFGQRQVDLGEGSYMADIERPNGDQRGWNWNGRPGAEAGEFLYTDNPYWVQRRNYPADNTDRLIGKAQLSYQLAEGLSADGFLSTDYSNERRQERIAVNSQALPAYTEDLYEEQETQVQARLNYNRDFTDDYSFSAFAATQYRYHSYNNNYGQTNGGLSSAGVYTLENSVSRPDIEDYFEENGVFSLFGQATVGYQDLVYLDATLRNDFSSTLPGDNNSYLYPSVSASFIFTALEALQDQDVLSYGKLRVGLAQVGSDTEPYRLSLTYPLGQPYGDRPVQSLPYTLPNADLNPERTTGYEVGTQLDFFNNRLGLDATYYYESTTDQIVPVGVSRASGYAEQVVNAGEITNEGVEVSLSATPVIREDFQWDVSINWATNNSTVQDLAEDLDSYPLGGAPFGPDIVARVEEPYGALYGTAFARDTSGRKVVSASGTYLTSDDGRQVLGNYQPDWTGGASTNFSYKGFSVSAAVNGQMGGEIYSVSNLFGVSSGIYQETVEDDVRQLGVVPEGVVYFPQNTDDDPDNNVTDYSDAEGQPFNQRLDANTYFNTAFGGAPDEAYIYDATYIRLREVRIGYAFPERLFGTLPIRRASLSLIGRNLATLYKKTPNFDPSTALSASNVQGIESGQIPPTRSYGFSLRLDL